MSSRSTNRASRRVFAIPGSPRTRGEPDHFDFSDAAGPSSVRESLNNLIRSAGFNVKTFSSAQQFLANQRPKTASCLVLDLQLSGLSGLDLQKELVKAGIQIPIIFVTGHGDIRRRCAP